MKRLVLPVLLADFKMVETYQPAPPSQHAAPIVTGGGITARATDAPAADAASTAVRPYAADGVVPCFSSNVAALQLPLLAIASSDDGRYSRVQVGEWAHCTAPGLYQELWLSGCGHNYIAQPPAALFECITAWLEAWMEQGSIN